MFLEYFIVLFFSFVSAVVDFRTGYIYDYITYPLIFLGVVFSLINGYFFLGLLSSFLVFIFGYLFYRYGKIGGGDVKLFLGISFMIPMYEGFPFIVLVLFYSSALCVIFYGIYYILILHKRGVFSKLSYLLLFCYFLVSLFLLYFVSFFMFFLSFFSMIILTFKSEINSLFVVNKSIGDLLEDDLIDLRFDGLNESYPLNLEKLNYLKEKYGLDYIVSVYENLPRFGPFIFLGVLFSYLGFII